MAIVLQPDASSPAWSRRPTNSRPLAAREFVVKVEDELQKFRGGVLALMDKNLIPSAIAGESKMSYYAMAGDYYRHLAELAAVETERKAAKDACEADKPRRSPRSPSTRLWRCRWCRKGRCQ